jgi:Na+-driven multidrug efflux pump
MEEIILLLIFMVFIFGFIAYIKSLVNAAKNNKWVWFVLMLLIWPIFIFYLISAYDSSNESDYSDNN